MSEETPAAFDRAAAAAALAEADESHRRSSKLHAYRASAPAVMLWGVVWIVADLTLAFPPTRNAHQWVWPLAAFTGLTLNIALAWFFGRSTLRTTERRGSRDQFWRMLATWGFNLAFIAAMFTVFAPFEWREPHAFWGLIVALLYCVTGVWSGLRLTALGILLGVLVMFAFFYLQGRDFLIFMGLACGGSMILGGLWLRKA